jgi:hypothetical protein
VSPWVEQPPVAGPTPELAAFLASLNQDNKGFGNFSEQYAAGLVGPGAAPAAGGGGGGAGGGAGGGIGFDGSPFDIQRQMLQDLYAQQLQSVQGMYDMGQGQIGAGLDRVTGSLGTIRDQYMAEAARMQQDQAAMLAGALGRVSQEQALLNADLAAQGGRTVNAAGVDARGLLETQGANQSALQSRLAELQAGAFADRQGGAEQVAQSGRQQLDLQRLMLQDRILQERLQALTDVDLKRQAAESAAAAARSGGGGGGRGGGGGGGAPDADGATMDAMLGLPPGTWDALPAAAKSAEWERYTSAPAGPNVAGMQLAVQAAAGDPNLLMQIGLEMGLTDNEILQAQQAMTQQAQQTAMASGAKRGGTLSTPLQRASAQVTGRKVNTRPVVRAPSVPSPQRVVSRAVQSGLRLFGG